MVEPRTQHTATVLADGRILTLGGLVKFDFQGDPSQFWGLAFSTTTGPTPLVIFDPADFRILNVGFELIGLWKIGALDGAGKGSLSLPLPPAVALAGLPIHSQMVTMFGTGTIVDEISAPNGFLMQLPGTSVKTLPVFPEDLDLHTASPLPNGDVLIAGGTVDQGATMFFAVDDYWVYGAQTAALTHLATSMVEPRTQHTATVLADGRILTLGGTDELGATRKTGEIFDPATTTSTPIPSMSVNRVLHSATLLADGRVFVAGGASSVDVSSPLTLVAAVLKSTEIYDPATNSWSAGPNLPKPRAFHGASRLGDGKVLITGGIEVTDLIIVLLPDITNDARRYDPVTNQFQSTAAFPGPRAGTVQKTLPNGDAVIVGGADGDLITQNFTCLDTCAVYNHVANTWTSVASMAKPRIFHQVELFNGDLYALGGAETFGITTLSGLPVAEIEKAPLSLLNWTPLGNTALAREQPRTAIFDAGTRILISGAGTDFISSAPDFTSDVLLP
jgi:hypothetical protein